jgi:hypothetical protein
MGVFWHGVDCNFGFPRPLSMWHGWAYNLEMKVEEMIRRSTKLLLCAFAVLVVSGIATASASAAEYLINSEALTGSETVTSKQSGTAKLTSTLNGSEVLIECTSGSGTGKIELAGKSTASIKYEGCSMSKPAGCKLTTAEAKEIKPVALVDVLGGTTGAFTDSFSPASGTEFVAIAFEKCTSSLNNGSHSVSGCAAAKASGAEEVVGTLEFQATVSGCALSFAGNGATITAKDEVELSGANKGKRFGIN